jgi:hypothetical protein
MPTRSNTRRCDQLFFDALHRSRRLQAQRILHQYRHLIARAPESMVHDPKSKEGRS